MREEIYKEARVPFEFALRRLLRAFPEVGPCPLEGHASQQQTRPCPCGSGVLARWPWVVQTSELGFCECDMASWELTCWRMEWISAGGPDLSVTG